VGDLLRLSFWRNASPVTFFDRVTEPILVHQGTADESCSH
jgi:dipeptidyl aminopeptidase/acylaminoacyl peptidase